MTDGEHADQGNDGIPYTEHLKRPPEGNNRPARYPIPPWLESGRPTRSTVRPKEGDGPAPIDAPAGEFHEAGVSEGLGKRDRAPGGERDLSEFVRIRTGGVDIIEIRRYK